MNIEQFLAGYISAALWSGVDDDNDPLDVRFNSDDIAPETLSTMRSDCERFIAENTVLLNAYAVNRPGNEQYPTAELAGHDFWLTRCGHAG